MKETVGREWLLKCLHGETEEMELNGELIKKGD